MLIIYKGFQYLIQQGAYELEILPNNMIFKKILRYFINYMKRKEDWALHCRKGHFLRGHNTNNFVERSMGIIKDIVLNR